MQFLGLDGPVVRMPAHEVRNEEGSMAETGTLKDFIRERLGAELAPSALEVVDESHLHAGPAGWRESGETHFRVDVVSAAFEGKSRVDRHRIVKRE